VGFKIKHSKVRVLCCIDMLYLEAVVRFVCTGCVRSLRNLMAITRTVRRSSYVLLNMAHAVIV
jgi:hypothetical protein